MSNLLLPAILTMVGLGIPFGLAIEQRFLPSASTVPMWMSEVWNQENYSVGRSLVTESFSRSGPFSETQCQGISEYFESIEELRRVIPNLTLRVGSAEEIGDELLVRWTLVGSALGTHGDSRPITLTGSSIFTFEGEKIAMERMSFDSLDLDRELTSRKRNREEAALPEGILLY